MQGLAVVLALTAHGASAHAQALAADTAAECDALEGSAPESNVSTGCAGEAMMAATAVASGASGAVEASSEMRAALPLVQSVGLAAEPTPAVELALRAAWDVAGALTVQVREELVRMQKAARDQWFSADAQLQAWTARFSVDATRERWTHINLAVLRQEPVPGHASSGFGWRRDPIRHHAKFHRGTDIRAPHGTPVGAAGDGVVIFAGRQGGYGNVVYIDHGGGVVTRYGHLARIDTKLGAAISAGARLGRVGSTGRSTGPHLHFEVRLDGRAVNPVDALQVAALQAANDERAALAMTRLSPHVQEAAHSPQDPPRRVAVAQKHKRPYRGQSIRRRPVS